MKKTILAAMLLLMTFLASAQIKETCVRMDTWTTPFYEPYQIGQLIRVKTDSVQYSLTHATATGQTMQTVMDSSWAQAMGKVSIDTAQYLHVFDSIHGYATPSQLAVKTNVSDTSFYLLSQIRAASTFQPIGTYLIVESDPNVPAWAKMPSKPSYTYSEVGAQGSGNEVRILNRKQVPLVTFMMDDAVDVAYRIFKPMFDLQGVDIGLSIPTDYVGLTSPATFLTWTQLQELQTDGWEILSHGKTHTDLTTLSNTQIRSELSLSKTAIENHSLTVNNFVYPFNAQNANIRNITAEYYRSARGNIIDRINPIMLLTYGLSSIQSDDTTKLQVYKDSVDVILAQKKWGIFYFHAYDAANDSAAQRIKRKMSTLIDYIQSKGISIVTPNQALDSIGNSFEYGEKFVIGENGGIKISYVGQSANYDSIYVKDKSTGQQKTAIKPPASPWQAVGGTINYPTGNVGIGTTAPGYKLEVNGSIAGLPIYLGNSGLFSINTGVEGIIYTPYNASPRGHLFYAGGVPAVKFTYDGKVGIGTTSPVAKLHVAGGIKLDGTDTTGVGSTSKIGIVQYYNNHFYGLKAGTPPTWTQLDN